MAERYFVAVAPPFHTAHRLAGRLQNAFEDHPIPGNRVDPQHWHLTLRFLGPLEPMWLDRLLFTLDDADLGDAFTFVIDGLGAFPRPERAQVLWAGVGDGEAHLLRLQADVEEALVAAGWEPEDRPFVPHLTLSTLRPVRDVWPWLERDADLRSRWRVEELTVFASTGSGRRYSVVETFPLST